MAEAPAFPFGGLRYGARMTRRVSIMLPLALLLAACGPGENDPGPGGVTVSEAEALDEAAAMIEARKLPPEALDNPSASAQERSEAAAQTPGRAQQ